MQTETLKLVGDEWAYIQEALVEKSSADLVFMFGDTDVFKDPKHYCGIRHRYPNACIVGCSSSGNVMGVEVSNASLIATAVSFDSATVKLATVDFNDSDNVEVLAKQLMTELNTASLKHVFIISDGLMINGSELARGLNSIGQVAVTGGLAGDGARFQETYVIANDVPRPRRVAAIGFYGDSLTISSGCYAGWSEFGTQRLITRSKGNVVYEIDGEPALDLYKKYLGDYAKDLPNSGLRFPLNIKKKEGEPEVIRTLLAIDEDEKSITFAGDVPNGYFARLMKPDIDTLIDGAGKAAQEINQANDASALGLVVSCVGRKLIMRQEVEEELDAIRDVLGDNVQLTGFYSYGEIAPLSRDSLSCQLHNQTMTLTTIYEK